jgi:hypothetical protein
MDSTDGKQPGTDIHGSSMSDADRQDLTQNGPSRLAWQWSAMWDKVAVRSSTKCGANGPKPAFMSTAANGSKDPGVDAGAV